MADPQIVVNGRTYPLPTSFTMGELADMEEITGQDYDLSKGGVKGTMALAYVAIRRADPTVTVEDIRNLGQDDIGFEGVDDNPPSTGAPASESGESAPSSTADSANGSA